MRSRVRLPLPVLLALLAACGGGEEEVRPADESAATVSDPALAPVRSDSAGGRLPSELEALQPALEGTEWVLVALPGAPGPPAGARATLVLDGERGVLSGSTGCGTFDGSYTLEGGRLKLGVTGVARAGCPEALARLERDYLEALRLTGSWRLTGDTLELVGEGGAVARLRP